MKIGNIVSIYSNPATFQEFEGKAILIEEYRPDEGDGFSMWKVEFLDDLGEVYLRTIYTPRKE